MNREHPPACPPEDAPPGAARRSGRPLPRWLGYAGAVAAVATATLGRFALDPVLGDRYPFVTYTLAVAFVAWFGRTPPTVVTLVLGGACACVLFVPPHHAFAPGEPGVLVGSVMFLAVAGTVVAMSHALRTARTRCEGLLTEAGARECELRRAGRAEIEQRERLRASEERLRLALGAARMIAWEYAPATDTVTTSDNLSDLYGLPPGTSLAGAEEGFRLVHPDDVAGHRAAVDAAVSRNEGYVSRFRIVRPDDGRAQWMEEHGRPVHGPDGALRLVGVVADISDRVRAEDELRAGERRLRLALDAARMVVWDWDPAADRATFSANAADVFGLPGGATLTNSAEAYPLVHPDDLDRHRATVQAAAASGRGYRTEFRMVRRDTGETIWLEERASAVTDAAGRTVRLIGIDVDVTGRRRAEERAALLTAAVESANDAVIITEAKLDRPGPRIEYVNPAYTRMTGYAFADAVGQTPRVLQGPKTSRALLDRLRRDLAERQEFTGETINYRKDGSEYIVEWRITPMRGAGGGVEKWVAVQRDVTDRRRTDERLRASEEKFRTLFERMDEGFCVIEFLDGPHGPLSDYVHIEANPAYLANAGIPNVVGRKVREMVPDEADGWVQVYRDVLLTGRPVRFERELVATGRHLDLAAFRVEPADRRQVAVLFKDVTARKRAEAQLRDQDRRKDEFLATLAHELRNPLAPIRNGLQIIRLSGADGPVGKARAMMDRQLDQMVRLVDDLLDVSRITRGKLDLRRERVSVRAVIDAAVETAGPQIGAAGHELTVRVPDPPAEVDGDPARLAQVVSNLLTNSAKYTPPGGHIRLTAERAGATVAVSVRDDGIGIPPAMLGRVFDMFTQVDRALEKTTGGLGIGLSLVKGLVEMHGGTVEARSDGEGRGSEFVVRLPVAAAGGAPEGGRGSGPADEARPAARRVLVVDDNADAADSLAQLLKILGNEVRTAYDGEAGVAAAAAFRPHLVFLDIGMPKVNGFEACRRIRAEPWGDGVTLVALTGWGQNDDRRKTAAAGFDHHLVKPVEYATLTKLMATTEPPA
ncbi:PAS domain S-box protein [Gemmata sp. JC673]|uniref:histidine kinase n=1 Tax=Gemmata algarum TaxID=2975278 RepID=A0ABU5F4K5_9BACT|nr:PAS domain S-box protein [Gemmata algarum]MDY3562419.1 PAS domain S-box protein [Gemmata algarum]